MTEIAKLYVHRSRWTERAFAPGHIIHTAHRPLLGHTTWEGSNVGWGCHFAALTDSGKWPESAWMESNQRNDARELMLIDNAVALELAEQRRAERGGRYDLAAYVAELGPEDGPAEFVRVYELPWDAADRSADARVAAVAPVD